MKVQEFLSLKAGIEAEVGEMGLEEGVDLRSVSFFLSFSFFFFFFFGLFFLCPFRAASMAYGGSQARGLNRAVVAGLYHSHNNARSEPSLQPTPQLMATPDP